MLRFFYFADSQGGSKYTLAVFDKWFKDWVRDDYDHSKVADSWGFDLNWDSLGIVNGVNSDRLPNIKIIRLGNLITGENTSHEEENPDTRRTFRYRGTDYQIVERTRLTYRENLYRWFGKVSERKRVWHVTGHGAPEFSFGEPEWDVREPTDPEIIESAFETKALVESIHFEESQ